jgi:hypothetical protein
MDKIGQRKKNISDLGQTKYVEPIQDAAILPQRMISNILKNRFSNTLQTKIRFYTLMVFGITHLTIYGRKIVSRHFLLVRKKEHHIKN